MVATAPAAPFTVAVVFVAAALVGVALAVATAAVAASHAVEHAAVAGLVAAAGDAVEHAVDAVPRVLRSSANNKRFKKADPLVYRITSKTNKNIYCNNSQS